MVELIFPWEHWVAVDEFSHYTTDSPNIDFLRVGSTNQQLRRAVPASSYIVSHLFLPRRLLDLPGKPEVTYFKFFLVTDEQVLGLDVPVHEVEGVHVGESFEELVHVEADKLRIQPI